MKQVTILLRHSPLSRTFTSESLRMTLVLTLSGNEVKVVLAEEGVYLLQASAPEQLGLTEIHRHVRTLQELGCLFVAEKESMDERGIPDAVFPVDQEDRRAIAGILSESDLVIGC